MNARILNPIYQSLIRISPVLVVFFAGWILSSSFFVVQCTEHCDERTINPKILDATKKLKTGDLILTNSPDMLSAMFSSLGGCNFSGIKIVYRSAELEKIYGTDLWVLVSDAATLNDPENGLRLEPFIDYFTNYHALAIRVQRPQNISTQELENIHNLALRARDTTQPPIWYDLGYIHTNFRQMNCVKMAHLAYGERIAPLYNDPNAYVDSAMACDLKLENTDNILPKTVFWKSEETNE